MQAYGPGMKYYFHFLLYFDQMPDRVWVEPAIDRPVKVNAATAIFPMRADATFPGRNYKKAVNRPDYELILVVPEMPFVLVLSKHQAA